MFAEHGWDGADPGLALIRDGNGTRSIETLMRYSGAAMAEFTRALRILKALQVEQSDGAMELPACRPAVPVSRRVKPNEPESRAALPLDHVMPEPPVLGPVLHEPAAPWLPERPDAAARRVAAEMRSQAAERT